MKNKKGTGELLNWIVILAVSSYLVASFITLIDPPLKDSFKNLTASYTVNNNDTKVLSGGTP